MSGDGRTVLVTGATGQQGGRVARRLLDQGWKVRTFTRDSGTPAAQGLAAAGAEVVEGDFDERASLDQAMEGAYGVFSVVNFWLPGVGYEGEARHGKAIADAAKAASVRHFVYSSVGGAERHTGIPHFESKWEVEEHIRAIDLPATIIRPVAFMENYFYSRDEILGGTLSQYNVRPDKTVQLIAADDIAAFVALAFDKPDDFTGKALEIAGENSTMTEQAAVFSRVIGRPVQYVETPPNSGWSGGEDAQKMIRWFNEEGYRADVPSLRKMYPGLMNLETWLRRTGWTGAGRKAA